jgi:hypothetical protein
MGGRELCLPGATSRVMPRLLRRHRIFVTSANVGLWVFARYRECVAAMRSSAMMFRYLACNSGFRTDGGGNRL